MMDTILNLGMNDQAVKAVAAAAATPVSHGTCNRRFRQMYGDVVLGMKPNRKKTTIRSR